MELNDMRKLIERWEGLSDQRYALDSVKPGVANLEVFFKEEVLKMNTVHAYQLMADLEKADEEYKLEQERRQREQLTKAMEGDIKQALDDTTWSMLPDAPLSNNGKKLYRDYRQYVRDIPELWDRQQISKFEVMSFEEWRKNPPVYKVVRKEIL